MFANLKSFLFRRKYFSSRKSNFLFNRKTFGDSGVFSAKMVEKIVL